MAAVVKDFHLDSSIKTAFLKKFLLGNHPHFRIYYSLAQKMSWKESLIGLSNRAEFGTNQAMPFNMNLKNRLLRITVSFSMVFTSFSAHSKAQYSSH
jgi:hypothetical protein